MSLADGIMQMEIEEERRLVNVVKHPTSRPTRIEVPMTPSLELHPFTFDRSLVRQYFQATTRK